MDIIDWMGLIVALAPFLLLVLMLWTWEVDYDE